MTIRNLKFSRLIQPRNPLFWLLVLVNGLSSAISFVLHAYQLSFGANLLLAGFALGNVVVGIVIALRLMADAPAMHQNTEGRVRTNAGS